MFLMSVPLVRDFIALFPETLEFREGMRRKPFWKAVAGFVLSYLVIATFFYEVWFHLLITHVRHHGELFADIGIFVPALFCLAAFLPLLSAQARRLHDARLSGWWMLLWLIPYLGWLVLLVLFLLPSRAPLRPGT
ncbi:MAG: DUF805 domain-containing protein [Gammaproteobacteria bacterium]|nr:DUF805 domain-containing protein [Gammaproteobacteria bacterium]